VNIYFRFRSHKSEDLDTEEDEERRDDELRREC
jgi:hypothetical protein